MEGEAGASGASATGLIVADPAHGALLAVDRDRDHSGATDGSAQSAGGGVAVIADAYEGTALLGPTALARCALPGRRGEMLAFCDAGARGDSSVDAPVGSVFVIMPEMGATGGAGALEEAASGGGGGGSVLRPVCLRCLADPSDVALLAPPASAPPASALTGKSAAASASPTVPLSPIGFVAERGAGRVWKFCEAPAGSGAYHMSVFAHIGGGDGPSALAVDGREGPSFGTVYVGVGESAAACAVLRAGGARAEETGARVLALDVRGAVRREWGVPQLAEVTGMCMDPSGAGLLVSGVGAWSGEAGDGKAASGKGVVVRIGL